MYDSALRVMEAVIMEYPHRAELYAKAGSLCMKMRNFSLGSHFFQQAYDREINSRYAYFAALCMLQEGLLDDTQVYLKDAFSQQAPDQDVVRLMTAVGQIIQMEDQLSTKSDAALLSRLARNYFLIGLGDEARRRAEQSLRLQPDNQEAVLIIRQLDEQQNS